VNTNSRIIFSGATLLISMWLPNTALFASNDGFKRGDRDIVVILHGFGRSKAAMWKLSSRIKGAGFRVKNIGYRSLSDTPERISQDIDGQIEDCCFGKSPKLHFVGHSLGGLMIRAYLANKNVSNLGRVVLIGTPNNGSEIVDSYGEKWWFKLLGPTAQALGTNHDSLTSSLPIPNYPLGVIAGKSNTISNDELLTGEGDGFVSVDSAKIEGMADFVVVDSGHMMLRYNRHVADQTIQFLRQGHFRNNDS
jgi:pimeloyl-ACP methyl ester carboxylesterase